MQADQQIAAIAANVASIAAQDFLSRLLPCASKVFSLDHLVSLDAELQAELKEAIYSRLLWFYQGVQVELENQQRQQQPTTARSSLVPNLEPGSGTNSLVNKAKQLDFAEQKVSKQFLSPEDFAPEMLGHFQDSEGKPKPRRRRRRSAAMV